MFLEVLIAWDAPLIKGISVWIHRKSVIAGDMNKIFPPDTGSLQNNFKLNCCCKRKRNAFAESCRIQFSSTGFEDCKQDLKGAPFVVTYSTVRYCIVTNQKNTYGDTFVKKWELHMIFNTHDNVYNFGCRSSFVAYSSVVIFIYNHHFNTSSELPVLYKHGLQPGELLNSGKPNVQCLFCLHSTSLVSV